MRTTVFKRIISAVMAAVVSAGMLSAQELTAFAELADSAQTQIPSFESNLNEHFSAVLEEDGVEYAADAATEGDYTYTVTDGKATITKYSGSASSLTIPSTLGGYPVTVIGESAFSFCQNLTSITIPDSVTSIGTRAFWDCASLTSITIPDSVTSIERNPFVECVKLSNINVSLSNSSYCDMDGILFSKDKTQIIAFPGGRAGSYAIPDGVTSIRDDAFSYCQGLINITIPDSVTSIGNSAFLSCTSLTSIAIPDGVPSIGECAFFNCSSLISISIPDSVSSISSNAFCYCSNLKTITIPYGVTSILTNTFSYCTSLSSITIPNSITLIGYGVFYECNSLTSITIPDSVTTIEDNAFNCCTSLTNVYYSGTLSKWERISIGTGNECLTKNINIGYGNNKSPNVSTDNPGTITIKDENGKLITITTTDNKDHKLKQAQYNCGLVTKNILTNYYKIEPKSIKHDVKFTFQAEETRWVSSYILMCGANEVARSSTGIITLKNTALPVGRNYYVIVLLNNGTAVKTPLMFEVVQSPPEDITNKLELGRDGISIKVNDDIPVIGGHELSMDKIDLPVELLVCNGMAYVGVNIGDTYGLFTSEEKRKKFEKQFYGIRDSLKESKAVLSKDVADLKKDINGKSFKQRLGANDFETEFDVIGYGKTEWDENGFKTVEIDLVFIFKAEYKIQMQTVSLGAPMVLELSVKFEGKLSGTPLKYDFSKKQLSSELGLKISFTLEPYAGVGIMDLVSAGPVVKAQINADITLYSSVKSPGFDDISITCAIGAKLCYGPFEKKKYTAPITWHIYSRANGTAVQEMNDAKFSAGDMYNADNYTVSTQVYAADFTGSASDGVLISDIFPGAVPQIVTSNSATVMTFLSSNLDRGANNQVQLMYSVYNSEDGSWSEPAPVDSNDTNDWTHILRVINGDIWLLYQDSDTVLAEDADIDALADSFTVKAMIFDPETGAFAEPVCVSGTDGYNFMLALGETGESPAAAWVNNEDTDIFGLNSTNSIRYSTYSVGAWSEGVEIASGLNCVTDLAVGELDGKLCIAYITDGDNDLTTADDRALYLYSDGNTTLLSEGAVSALYMGALPNAKNTLCWTEDGALNYIKAADGTKKTLFETTISGKYVVTDDAIIFSGDKSHIFAVRYNNGAWTLPVEVYSAEGTVSALAADKERLLAVDTVMTENGDDLEDSSDLHCISYRETENVTLEYVDFEYENISTTVPLEVCVTNNGMDTLTAVNVLITDDSANEVYSETISCSIASGDSEELTVTMPIETLDDRTYTISVTTENDSNPADNSAEFNLGKTEIDLSVCTIVDGGKAYLEVTAENDSAVAAGTVISVLDEDGNTIAEKDIGTLPANYKKTERFSFEELLGENDNRSVTVQLTVDKEEYYTHNNTLRQYLKAINTDIPYKYVTFLNTDGTLISGTIYDAETLITAPELPEGCLGWYAVGDETKTLIGDFSGINVDIAFMAKGPDIPCSVKAHSLLLGDDIGVKYYIEFSDDVLADTTSVIKFTVNGRETTAAVSEAAKTDNLYEFICPVAAAEMNHTITGQLYVGGQATGDSFTYSVKTYADYILANSEKYADEVPMVEAMLNYGAAAEKYFRGSTEISFTKPEITAEELAAYKYVVTDNDKAYDFVGQVITLNSKVTAKLYFSGKDFSVSDFTVKQNGISVDASRLCVNTDDKGTYLAISGISANEMGKAFTITVGGVTVSNYSVYSYVRRALNSTASGLSDVVAALYEYGCAAEEYTKSIA